MSDLDNKHRDASWKDIAAEFKSERDALRGDVLRIQEERDELIAALPTLKAKLAAAEAENARLKACVEAANELSDEGDYVVDRLSKLLAATVVVLRGPEPPLTRWSYHDIPERVSALLTRAETAERELAEAKGDAERYRWLRTRNEGNEINPPGPFAVSYDNGGPDYMNAESLDAAIDAAIAAKGAA